MLGVFPPMIAHKCPSCNTSATRMLPETTHHAIVHYYCCTECGHMWTLPKDEQPRGHRTAPLADAPQIHNRD